MLFSNAIILLFLICGVGISLSLKIQRKKLEAKCFKSSRTRLKVRCATSVTQIRNGGITEIEGSGMGTSRSMAFRVQEGDKSISCLKRFRVTSVLSSFKMKVCSLLLEILLCRYILFPFLYFTKFMYMFSILNLVDFSLFFYVLENISS